MTLEEVIQDLPFSAAPYKTKEELFTAWSKHLSIVAVKAEVVGNKKLTAAIDTLRALIPRIENFTEQEQADFAAASKVVGEFSHRFSKEGEEEKTELQMDILNLCQECDKHRHKAFDLLHKARELEREYRAKYGEPSGSINEKFFEDED